MVATVPPVPGGVVLEVPLSVCRVENGPVDAGDHTFPKQGGHVQAGDPLPAAPEGVVVWHLLVFLEVSEVCDDCKCEVAGGQPDAPDCEVLKRKEAMLFEVVD